MSSTFLQRRHGRHDRAKSYDLHAEPIKSPIPRSSLTQCTSKYSMSVTEIGEPRSLHYRLFVSRRSHDDLESKSILSSPWLDLRLYPHSANASSREQPLTVNAVCLTPQGCWVQYQVSSNEPFNPIRVKSSKSLKPAHYSSNCEFWSMGFLPQTVQESQMEPLPVIILGSSSAVKHETGDTLQVRLLGSIGQGNESWSRVLLGVPSKDSKFESATSVMDLYGVEPQAMVALHSWLDSNQKHLRPPQEQCSVSGHGGEANMWPSSAESAQNQVQQAHERWRVSANRSRARDDWTRWLQTAGAHLSEAWLEFTKLSSDSSIPHSSREDCSESDSDESCSEIPAGTSSEDGDLEASASWKASGTPQTAGEAVSSLWRQQSFFGGIFRMGLPKENPRAYDSSATLTVALTNATSKPKSGFSPTRKEEFFRFDGSMSDRSHNGSDDCLFSMDTDSCK